MNAKYFKALPAQEYVFKTFFTCAKNEGVCCSDCGTYITRIVQVTGKADGLVYNLGTSCCEKISKDRSVFLTPLSVQRKKLFINQFDKFQKIRKELESFAEDNDGACIKFYEADYDYQNNLRITIFIFCSNGFLIYNHLEAAQRCFTGLKEILTGYTSCFELGDFLDKKWSQDRFFELKDIVKAAYKSNNPGWNDNNSNWYCFLKNTRPELFKKWVHFEESEQYQQPCTWLSKYKTHPQVF